MSSSLLPSRTEFALSGAARRPRAGFAREGAEAPIQVARSVAVEPAEDFSAAIAAIVAAAGYRELILQDCASVAEAGEPGVLSARATAPRPLAKYLGAGLVTRREVLIIAAPPPESCDSTKRIVDRLVHRLCVRSLASPGCDIFLVEAGFTPEQLRELTSALRGLPVRIRCVADRDRAGGRVVELQRPPMNRLQHGLKRALDVVLSGIALGLLAPLLLVIAAAIRLESHGPALFRQTRRGRYGRAFTIFKFRTMTVAEDGPEIRQATRDDPRVTRIGRLLRRTSLDELPQLLNVLRGDMSLVGPRPHAVVHDEQFADMIEHYEVRRYARPGITGWAQANGLRGETSSPDRLRRRVEYDRYYVAHASLRLDLKILLLTLRELLSQENAY